MPKVKVTRYGAGQMRVVELERDATVGAVVGTNLFNADGSLTDLDALIAEAAANANGQTTGISLEDVQALADGPITVEGSLAEGAFTYGWDGTTSDVPEGSNLYYTDARADARIAAHDTVPCFLTDGTPSYMPLASDLTIPCFLSDGTASSLSLAA